MSDGDDCGNILLGGIACVHFVDERLVNFQQIRRKPIEIAQGRIPRTEVIYRDLDTHLLDLPYHSQSLLRRIDHYRFRDLDLELICRQAA